MIENLFFYNKTIVHIGREDIPKLFALADVDVLETLLRRYNLTILFNNSFPAIKHEGEARSVTYIHIELDVEKELHDAALEYSHDPLRSRKFAKKLSRLIGVHEYASTLAPLLNEELKNREFLKRIVDTVLQRRGMLQHSKADARFELEFLNSQTFKIHTNIDTSNPELFNVDVPILALINAVEDLKVMADNASEISLPEYDSTFLRLKANDILYKSNRSQREIDVFNHFVYNESWALREAINTKKLHVKAVLKTLDKADKYREWLQGLPDDGNLMAEYVAKIEEKSVLESLPFKAIRFYIFNSLYAIASAANPLAAVPINVVLSAFDSFVLDKLGGQWKPNQFIENELRPLVKQ